MSEKKKPVSVTRKNPLIWSAVMAIALISFVFLRGDRGESMPVISLMTIEKNDEISIDPSLLSPPGMRARKFIQQLRADGKPYPFSIVYDKAQGFLQEGSLADAHLLYFFAAREDHLPSIMAMGEMSDPTFFRAENSLLDQADVIQAYKWYQKAATMGDQVAEQRVVDLKQWARDQAEAGDSHALQLLLNFN